MHGPVPPELVDMIIDHVGSGHGQVRRPPLEGDWACKMAAIAYQTLKNCALVGKSWTCRSHVNLFRDVVLAVDGEERIRDLTLPSASSLELVKSLAIYVAPQNRRRGSITLHLLSTFSVCPLESLQIEGGLFPLGSRSALRACFDTLSGRLLDLTFRFCFFEPEPLRDILAIQNTKVDITFLGCDQYHPEDPARDNINWQPVNHGADRTLCVMGGDEQPSEDFLIDLSELSVQFSRLDVDFYEDGEFPDATQYLIDASAGVVSFLKLNVMSIHLPDDSEVFPPPDLALCVNLSELVLNMKGSYSCVVETPDTVLTTLLEANCPNLSRITVEVEDALAWFLVEVRGECVDSWKDLDSSLTTLARKSMNARGKKLVFVMEVTCTDDAIHRAKKWLPRLLPRFNEEGSLHAHDGEDDDCDVDNYDVEDGIACMGRAVLKKYEYESESDEKTEGDKAAERSEENKENQEGGRVKGGKKGEKDKGSDDGNEGDDEGEEEKPEENEDE